MFDRDDVDCERSRGSAGVASRDEDALLPPPVSERRCCPNVAKSNERRWGMLVLVETGGAAPTGVAVPLLALSVMLTSRDEALSSVVVSSNPSTSVIDSSFTALHSSSCR